ncbi:hypothetical protein Athai_14710 [Actinocatenispora thailandica]|uniref:Major facilitator superfamily (MFS) profile domain-containing protein n=1 Tax=Actinocatenispora thailandica TaxID=227318 RepID=A0A7R7HWB7_9ACTN|nr:MFS transporter [Actinocatenispora thailandica]BCJ33968.1 hypothetical protein Athai_14710 [Actinocatenispora thailandica]
MPVGADDAEVRGAVTAGPDPSLPPATRRRQVRPLYAAGFVTAFGAHSVAANLGGYTHAGHASLLTLGVLLAVYDGAEVVLKPVFGALTDRIGPLPVLLAGLAGFWLACIAVAATGAPALVGVARLGQGASVAAFSPAAGTLLARLRPAGSRGRTFGGYGAAKGLGYTLGPLLGGLLVWLGGYRILFAALGLLAAAVCLWAALTVRAVPPLPRHRATLADAVRAFARPGFLVPTVTLAAATAALSTGVGFLPVRGAALGPLVTGGMVALLSATATVVQPYAGRLHDAGRLPAAAGMALGVGLAAAGYVGAGWLPPVAGLPVAALLIGLGTGLATTLGFTALAAATTPDRLGTTMGAAEVGRETGDAGGPLLVGALAAGTTVTGGLTGLALLLAAATAAPAWAARRVRTGR